MFLIFRNDSAPGHGDVCDLSRQGQLCTSRSPWRDRKTLFPISYIL